MKSIFLIEDDLGIRNALKEALVGEGYEVFTANNGRDALEQLARSTVPMIDLILLDLMMPVMTGQEFLAEIQQRTLASDVPIAVFSATGKTYELQNKRISEIIKKPIDLDGLLEIVERYCA